MPVVAALKQTNNLIVSTIREVGLDAPPQGIVVAAWREERERSRAISTTASTTRKPRRSGHWTHRRTSGTTAMRKECVLQAGGGPHQQQKVDAAAA